MDVCTPETGAAMPKFQYVKTGEFEAPARFITKGEEALSGLLDKLTFPGTLPDRVDYILKGQMACEANIYSAISLIPLHKNEGLFLTATLIQGCPLERVTNPPTVHPVDILAERAFRVRTDGIRPEIISDLEWNDETGAWEPHSFISHTAEYAIIEDVILSGSRVRA